MHTSYMQLQNKTLIPDSHSRVAQPLGGAHLHFNRCLHFSGGSPEDLICTVEINEYRGVRSNNGGTDQLHNSFSSRFVSSRIQTPSPCAKYFGRCNEVQLK